MKIVLGLGNPGARYRWTRHNLGFRVAERLAERRGATFTQAPEAKAWAAEIELGGERVVLARPRTPMNRSGLAARPLCEHHGISPSDLLVVHDDADLKLGRVRIRPDGSAGGHRGLWSIIETLGSRSFPRVRLGIRGAGREGRELTEYVLEGFEEDERPLAEGLVELGADAVEAVLEHGLGAAMNRFNARPFLPGDPPGS